MWIFNDSFIYLEIIPDAKRNESFKNLEDSWKWNELHKRRVFLRSWIECDRI